jgi:hypothetical protein
MICVYSVLESLQSISLIGGRYLTWLLDYNKRVWIVMKIFVITFLQSNVQLA